MEKRFKALDEDSQFIFDKRSNQMELFLELDQNNDQYLDRSDLIRFYGELEQNQNSKFI
jgi:uncharacterized protein YdeI (BOF family)